MFLMISFCDVRFEVLHCLFSGLRNTANYRPLHSQQSVCCLFETLCKFIFVVSDHLIIIVSLYPRKIQSQPTAFISMINLAMENAALTGLISTKSGTLLEKRLRKPRSHSKMVFCNCLPIRDLRLRIWFCISRSKVGFAAVLF